ncbi:hypothetical protein AN958_00198, partial [Leucoagaricus sp. SymC.cos]
RPFCIVASPNTETDPKAHPFWYAQVIGIFHAVVQHRGSNSRDLRWKPIEFLWVRWLGTEHNYVSGRHVAKLPKIGFVPTDEPKDYPFSFLDPSLVIRGCHLLPAFVEGRSTRLMPYEGPTEARPSGEVDDWVNYYVNIFVDRDMFMRFIGLGVGHQPGTSSPHESDDAEGDEEAEDEVGVQQDNSTELADNDGNDEGEEDDEGFIHGETSEIDNDNNPPSDSDDEDDENFGTL